MTSLFIAKLLGLVIIIKMLGIFLKEKEIAEMVKELDNHKLVLYLIATIEFIVGLVIVMTHSVWEGWAMLITVVGWLLVIEGAYMMIFPIEPCLRLIRRLSESNQLRYWAVLGLIIGAFLLIKGFGGHIV